MDWIRERLKKNSVAFFYRLDNDVIYNKAIYIGEDFPKEIKRFFTYLIRSMEKNGVKINHDIVKLKKSKFYGLD